MYHNLEKQTELNSSRNVSNIYDTIDDVPSKHVRMSASSPSLRSTTLPPSATKAAAAAAAASYSAVTDSVDVQTDNEINHNLISSINDGNIYDSIDDVPTKYMNMSGSSPSPRSTTLPSATEAAAAATEPASYSIIADSVDIQTDNKMNSGINDGNFYDSIDDVPPAYQNLSASASQPTSLAESPPDDAACFRVDANNTYIPPSNSINDVPCCYQIEPNTKLSGGDYANCVQELDVGESTAYNEYEN